MPFPARPTAAEVAAGLPDNGRIPVEPTPGFYAWRLQDQSASSQTSQDAEIAANDVEIAEVKSAISNDIDAAFLAEFEEAGASYGWSVSALNDLKIDIAARDKNIAPIVGDWTAPDFLVAGGGQPDTTITLTQSPASFTPDFLTDAELQAGTDTVKLANSVELKNEMDRRDLLQVDKSEKADVAAIDAGTIDRWVDAKEHKDSVDKRRAILAGLGWVKPTGIVSELPGRQIKIDTLNLLRWDDSNNQPQSFSYPAAEPISFRVADRNGYVETGLGGEDLSAPVNTIEQSWGYDNNGTLEDIAAVAADTNDGVRYQLYVIPQSGEFVVLLPQQVVNTVTNSFYRRADETLVIPVILNGAVHLGDFFIDEDAGNFAWSTSQGTFPGQTTSSNAALDQAYQYAVDPTALVPAQMTENGVVGTGTGDSYKEYRVRTIGADWDTSTKEIVWQNLDTIYQRHPEPLPANGPLSFGRNYYGTDGAYTLDNWTSNIVDGVEQNARWLTLEQISSLNEDTKPSVTGKFKFSSTGQIFIGTLTASANFRWNLYWVDSDPDPANHAWLIHSNRELVLPINSLDDIGLLLTRTNHYTAFNGTASDWVLRVPGGSPSGRITFRYDQNSTGPIKLESDDGDVAPHRINLDGLVNWTQTIDVEHAGKLITIEANPQTDRWNIYIEAGAEDNRNLRQWEPGDGSTDVKYSAGEQVIVPMPINADWIADRNAVAGVNYVIKAINDRPNTVTEFNDVEADSGNWELIGAFRVSGNDFRTLTGTGTQALSFNDIGQTEAVSHTIPDGVTQSYLFSHSPSFITVFDDLIGTVNASRVDAANQVTFDVAGPATMKMTRQGNAVKFTFTSNLSTDGSSFNADMLDLATGDHGFTFDAANSDTTPTNTIKAIGGIGIRPVQANFTAAAQKQAWPITKDGDIAVYIPKHTVTPVTLQIGETATPANLFGVDIALDGKLSQPVAQPTNQLNGITATKFDNDEWWKIVLSGTRPTNVTLKVWGNDIGDGTDFEDIQYAFEIIDALVEPGLPAGTFERKVEWQPDGGWAEILNTGSNFVTNLDFSTASRIVVYMRERIDLKRYFHGIFKKEEATETMRFISGPFESWHVDGLVTDEATGAFVLQEFNVNAALESVVAYYDVEVPSNWVNKNDVIEVEPTDVVLIDVDAADNQLYVFSTGETWSDVKANYETLRIDLTVSDAGVNAIRPESLFFPPAYLEQMLTQSGFLLHSGDGVSVDLDAVSDTDTGFTYQQSSGDSPSNGRMQFTVTGVRKKYTVGGLDITNADTATAGQTLQANGDGTFTFV